MSVIYIRRLHVGLTWNTFRHFRPSQSYIMDNCQTIKLLVNNYKRWLCEESLKTPLLMTHFIFEFRGRPSLITVMYMNPHSLNKLIATEYCFLILRDDYRFLFIYLFIFRFFVILCYFVIINFYKFFFYYYFILLLFFYENYLYNISLNLCKNIRKLIRKLKRFQIMLWPWSRGNGRAQGGGGGTFL